MYACNTTVARCVVQQDGTLTQDECAGSCQCATPNNCGQLNGTTWTCQGKTHKIGGCNVCDACCQPWLTEKKECDGCFNTNVTHDGCGGK